MSFLNSVLKVFVGDKAKKDVKGLQPIIDKIHSFEKELELLSLDEIRNKTIAFKAQLKEDCKAIKKQ